MREIESLVEAYLTAERNLVRVDGQLLGNRCQVRHAFLMRASASRETGAWQVRRRLCGPALRW
jgi:hypothetical protein